MRRRRKKRLSLAAHCNPHRRPLQCAACALCACMARTILVLISRQDTRRLWPSSSLSLYLDTTRSSVFGGASRWPADIKESLPNSFTTPEGPSQARFAPLFFL